MKVGGPWSEHSVVGSSAMKAPGSSALAKYATHCLWNSEQVSRPICHHLSGRANRSHSRRRDWVRLEVAGVAENGNRVV